MFKYILLTTVDLRWEDAQRAGRLVEKIKDDPWCDLGEEVEVRQPFLTVEIIAERKLNPKQLEWREKAIIQHMQDVYSNSSIRASHWTEVPQ